MTLQTYKVHDSNPLSIAPSGKQGSLHVLNDGPNEVYISDTAGGRVDSAYRINAKGTIQWNTNVPLYAFTIAGGRASLLVNDSSVQLANTQVDATVSGNVGVDGAVSANILNDVIVNRGPGDVLFSDIISGSASPPSIQLMAHDVSQYSSIEVAYKRVNFAPNDNSFYPVGLKAIQFTAGFRDSLSHPAGRTWTSAAYVDTRSRIMRWTFPVVNNWLNIWAFLTEDVDVSEEVWVTVTAFRSVVKRASYIEIPFTNNNDYDLLDGNGVVEEIYEHHGQVPATTEDQSTSYKTIPTYGGLIHQIWLRRVSYETQDYAWIQPRIVGGSGVNWPLNKFAAEELVGTGGLAGDILSTFTPGFMPHCIGLYHESVRFDVRYALGISNN